MIRYKRKESQLRIENFGNVTENGVNSKNGVNSNSSGTSGRYRYPELFWIKMRYFRGLL